MRKATRIHGYVTAWNKPNVSCCCLVACKGMKRDTRLILCHLKAKLIGEITTHNTVIYMFREETGSELKVLLGDFCSLVKIKSLFIKRVCDG